MVGPAIIRHNSRTLIPSRIRGGVVVGGGKGIGGVCDSKLVMLHGGNLLFTCPFVEVGMFSSSRSRYLHVVF